MEKERKKAAMEQLELYLWAWGLRKNGSEIERQSGLKLKTMGLVRHDRMIDGRSIVRHSKS